VIRRLAVTLAVLAALAAPGRAQLEWDKPKVNRPLPNPSPVRMDRDHAVALAKAVLAEKDYAVKGEDCDHAQGGCVLTTEPKVFTRGIVAGTQYRHFADLGASDVRQVSRGRVALRVEVSPSSTTQALVGVYGTFEGLVQSPSGSQWVASPSRGLLEDEILRCIVARSQDRPCEDAPGEGGPGADEGEPTEDAPTPTGGSREPRGGQAPPRP
jgi:hypothetical protein